MLLEDVVPDGYVRATDDGLVYAMDLAAVVTQKKRDDASLALRRLDEDVFSQDKICYQKHWGQRLWEDDALNISGRH